MDEGKVAIAMVQCAIDQGKTKNFEVGVKDSRTGRHFLVTVEEYEPSTFQEIMESVLYPAAANVCLICGK